MPKVGKLERMAKYRTVLDGVRARMPHGPLKLEGKDSTRQEVEDALQGMLDEMAETDRLYRTYLLQVRRERQREKALQPIVRAVQTWAKVTQQPGASTNLAFAIKAGKPGPKTVAAKVAMVEKAKATRKLRGTMGRRQRKKLKA
jgi:hypothetical protein